jgi:hypothetical protein
MGERIISMDTEFQNKNDLAVDNDIDAHFKTSLTLD